MFMSPKFINILIQRRLASTAASTRHADLTQPVLATSEEGYQLASIDHPNPWPGLSHVALVFNAGSRYETNTEDRGISHLIRRACGLSTVDHTAVNLTRHFQQMGARFTCATTREHMIYSVDAAPNVITRAAQMLAEVATDCTFYEWELRDIANKLMLKDIDLLHRRNLPALAVELLHEAAFGVNPSGCGLGFSLFAASDRLGSFSLDQIERYLRHNFAPSSTVFTVVGSNEGLNVLKEAKTGIHSRPPLKPTANTYIRSHGFVGGELRRDLAAADRLHTMFAWPTGGMGHPDQLALDVAAYLLTGALGRIAYTGGLSTQKYLATSDADLTEDSALATAFNKTYSGGHGLFGVYMHGRSSAAVAQRLATLIPRLITGLSATEEEVSAAKRMLQADILMNADSPAFMSTDLAIQLSRPERTYTSPEQRAAEVGKVNAAAVMKALKKTVTSGQAAMSVVGMNTGEVPPLRLLIAA